MKYFIIILVLSTYILSPAQDKPKKIVNCNLLPIDSIKNSQLYEDIVLKIKKENKIDVRDASQIKLLSSSSFIAFEQTPDSIVTEYGKLNQENIINLLHVKEEKTDYFLILTNSRGFLHLFIYDDLNNDIENVNISGPNVISRVDSIFYYGHTDSTIIYNVNKFSHRKDKLKRYYIYNNNKKALYRVIK